MGFGYPKYLVTRPDCVPPTAHFDPLLLSSLARNRVRGCRWIESEIGFVTAMLVAGGISEKVLLIVKEFL